MTLVKAVPRSFWNPSLNKHLDEWWNKHSLVFSQQGSSIWDSLLFLLIDFAVLFSTNWYCWWQDWECHNKTQRYFCDTQQPSGEGEWNFPLGHSNLSNKNLKGVMKIFTIWWERKNNGRKNMRNSLVLGWLNVLSKEKLKCYAAHLKLPEC